MNNFTRFVIHGHDFTSAITQLYLTLGTTPTFLFPCSSGYTNANQRRITTGILNFMVVEIVGLGIPFMIISACFVLRMGNTVVSDSAFISMCIYPIFGPYYVLMSNTDYSNKVKGILRKAQELGSRSPTN
ncbi:unnamed protein product [Auanema sp. JU1783]|nr:unnamed protein product [Auanema sp. JU1783]